MKSYFSHQINMPMIQMFKIMTKMDKCDRYNRFKIILNQVRGHCFKYFKFKLLKSSHFQSKTICGFSAVTVGTS